MTEVVTVHATATLTVKDEPASADQAEQAVRQAVRDTVEGTYQPLAKQGPGATIEHINTNGSATHFVFSMPGEMFPAEAGGLQHLVGVLAGDTFAAPTGGVAWQTFAVDKLDLPPMVTDRCAEVFRAQAIGPAEVRQQLSLDDAMPLLAHSFKPRTGVPIDVFRATALDVLDTGFNLVEPDTRRLNSPGELVEWIALGREAAATRLGSTAFAPNLTLPADLVVESAAYWRQEVPEGPFVIKIDGGLDGLSAIQAIRRAADAEQPIITCYPLLRGTLASRLGPATWVQLLTLSGVDVIYPGSRPSFGGEKRPIWAERLGEAARFYWDLLNRGEVMPTYAGGADPADLHVAYELLGPGTAFFLGGAVALHQDGAASGAQVCVEAVRTAATLAAKAKGKTAEPFPPDLIDKIQDRYPLARRYIEPSTVFTATPESPDPPLPWRLA